MSTVVVDQATVCFGDHVAVDQLSLAVEQGETVAVVGPSGSGKSTLLRAIAGLQTLESGRILIGDRDVSGVPTHKRDLGLMFQDHALFAHLDVRANIEYGLRFGDRNDGPLPFLSRSALSRSALSRSVLSRSERHRRSSELLELVGLASYGERSIESLSGGESQRVALARALAPEPGLLMLDEPLGSLDRNLRVQLVEDLRRLLEEVGQTALYVTHDQTEAFALADRVAVMDHGRLLAVGRPAELWADPGLEFVANFLGHRNIWTVDKAAAGHIRWGSHELGEASGQLLAAAPGLHRVVAPASAFSATSSTTDKTSWPGLLRATVETVDFDQGVNRVHASVEADNSSVGSKVASTDGANEVHLEMRQTVSVGDCVYFDVDIAQLALVEPIQEP